MTKRRRRNRSLPIRRQRCGRGFRYLKDDDAIDDAELLDRIKKLAIPPAWREVEISLSPRAKIQARGIDAAGRIQTIYHPSFRARRELEKFDRLVEFGTALPRLREQVQRDLRRRSDDQTRVTACLTLLLDVHSLRIGSPVYAVANQSFGASTLRRKHLKRRREGLELRFQGKSRKQHRVLIEDPKLEKLLMELRERPGHEIFSYLDTEMNSHVLRPEQLNAYLAQHLGQGFTAKDFRTWGGTLAGYSALLNAPKNLDAKDKLKLACQAASTRLGNTPAIARSSYIDPRVLSLAGEEELLASARRSRRQLKARKHLDPDERSLLSFLKRN